MTVSNISQYTVSIQIGINPREEAARDTSKIGSELFVDLECTIMKL